MRLSWTISLVLLALLGSALLADAQTTYHPAAAAAPQNFQIIRSVGQATDDATNNFGYQSQIWLNWQAPQNFGNDGTPGEYGAYLGSATSTWTCTTVTGAVCSTGTSVSYLAYGQWYGTTNGNTATYDLILKEYSDALGGGQNIQPNASYSIQLFSVNSYGVGAMTSALSVRVGYKGTPQAPSWATGATFISPSSFVVTWTPSKDLGQADFNLTQTLYATGYDVQVRRTSELLSAAALNWYSPDNTLVATAYAPSTGFHTESMVIQAIAGASTNSGALASVQFIQPNTSYQVRVRANTTWGRGLWSTFFAITTPTSVTNLIANPVTTAPSYRTSSSMGGLFTWSMNASQTTGNANIIGVAGSTIQSFWLEWSCRDITLTGTTTLTNNDTNCPTSTSGAINGATWQGASYTNLTYGAGRVTGGSGVINNIPAASTPWSSLTANSQGFYARVNLSVSGSASQSTGVVQDGASWLNFQVSNGTNGAIAWGGNGANFQTCWGVSTSIVTACQAVLSQPTSVGALSSTTSNPSYNFAKIAGTAGTLTYSFSGATGASIFGWAQYTFTFTLVSVTNGATFDVGVANALNAGAFTAAGAAGTVNDECNTNGTACQGKAGGISAPTFWGRDGTANPNYFLAIGKGTGAANGWVAYRFSRAMNAAVGGDMSNFTSGFNSSNSGSALGILNWTVYQFKSTGAVGTANTITDVGVSSGNTGLIALPQQCTLTNPAGFAGTTAAGIKGNLLTGAAVTTYTSVGGTGLTNTAPTWTVKANTPTAAITGLTVVPTYGVASGTIVATGAGYTTNDVIGLATGVAGLTCTVSPLFLAGQTGALTAGAITVINPGSCSALPTNAPTGLATVTSGAGTGATITLSFGIVSATIAGTPSAAITASSMYVTASVGTGIQLFAPASITGAGAIAATALTVINGNSVVQATLPTVAVTVPGGTAGTTATAKINYGILGTTAIAGCTKTGWAIGDYVTIANVAGSCEALGIVTAAGDGSLINATGVTIQMTNPTTGAAACQAPVAYAAGQITNAGGGTKVDTGCGTGGFTYGIAGVVQNVAGATYTNSPIVTVAGGSALAQNGAITANLAATTVASWTITTAGSGYAGVGPTLSCILLGQAYGSTTAIAGTAFTPNYAPLASSFPMNGTSAASTQVFDQIGLMGIATVTSSPITYNRLYISATTGGANSGTQALLHTATYADPAGGAFAAPTSAQIVDVTDTTAVFLYTVPAAAVGGGLLSDYPGASNLGGSAAYTFSIQANYPSTSAVAAPAALLTGVNTCSLLSAAAKGNPGQANDSNTIYNTNFSVQCSGFVPGRAYLAKGGYSVTVGGTANTSTYAANVGFTTGSQQMAAPNRNPNVNGGSSTLPVTNSYYYATATSYQLFYQPAGQQIGDNVSLGGTSLSGQTAHAGGNYYIWSTQTKKGGVSVPNAQRAQIVTTAAANLALSTTNFWDILTVSSGTTQNYRATIEANGSFSITVALVGVTTPSAVDSVTISSSADAAKVPQSAGKVGTAVRRVTDTSAWIEVEGPSDVGTTAAANPWVVTNCAGTGTATVANIAGTTATSLNFNLIVISALTGTSGSCGSATIAYANTAGTSTTTASISSFTLASASTSVPGAAPAAPTFDQVTTQSFLVYVPFPQVAGGGLTTAGTTGNGLALPTYPASAATVSDVQIITGGTTYNVISGNVDTGTGGPAAYSSVVFNGTATSYAAGFTVRLVSYTNTATTPVTSRIAQATAYTVQAFIRNNNASNNLSAVSSAGALPLTGGLTSNNGDQPDAPTGLAASRITSTSVRLTFNRPINMGGAPLGISAFATGTIAPLLSGTNQLFRVWYSFNGGANTALTSLTMTVPTTLTSGNANPGVLPNYKNSVTGTSLTLGWLQSWYVDVTVPSATAGGSYSFMVAANNQFSYATASATGVLVTSDKINTASASVTLAAANTAPTAPSLTVTYFSNFYVYLAWSDSTNFGTNNISNYQVQKSTGGGAAANVGTQVALNAGYAMPYSVVDTTGVTPGTQYSYTLVTTAGALTSTSAGVNVTPDTANTSTTTPNTPGAPAVPIVVSYSDSATAIQWLGPQDQGGVQTSSTTAFYAYQVVQTFQAATGEPTASNCPVYIVSATTGNFGSASYSTIPGKAYSYTVAAMIQYTPNGKTVAVTPVGSPSAAATQAANSIKKAYPYPVITWATTSKNGGGYLTLGQSVASASSNSGVTTSTTVNGGMDGKGGPGYSYTGVTSQNGLGVLVEQMSPQNSTTVGKGTFNPDTFYWYPSFGSTTSSYVISGLVAKSTYRFKLNSVNGFANAEQTAADVTATTGTSVAPTAVSTITSNILAKRPTSILLSWAPPTETGGVGNGILATYKSTLTVVGQTAVAFTNSTVTTQAWSPYQALSGVFTGLTSGASYTVNVWGSNGKETANPPAGSFVASQPAGNGLNNQVTTGQVPDLPVSLAVSSNTATQVVLSWSFTGNVGSSAITSYLITGQSVVSTGGSGAYGAFTSVAVANVVAPLTGTISGSNFVNGGLYRVQVGAVNAVSSTQSGSTTGEASAAVIFQATINAPTPNTVPTAMGKPVLTFYSPNEYRVSWADSSSLTANPSNYYLLNYWTVGNRVVYSTNVAGYTLKSQYGSLQLQQVGAAQYVPINGYQTGGRISTCSQIVYTILPSTAYYVAVAGVDATNNVGTYSALPGSTSPFVPVQTQTATAAAPTTLSATGTGAAITNTSYTITFNAPTYTGIAQIFGYQITTSPEYGGRQITGYLPVANSTTARATTAYTYTQTGLQPGTNYIVNARSLNSYGASIPSQNLRVTTTGGSAFSAQTSFWTLVLLALASILAFAF